MARTDPQINIRVPAELKAKIEEQAKVSGRSMNSELIAILESNLANDTDEKLDKIELLIEENNEKLEEVLKRLDAKE